MHSKGSVCERMGGNTYQKFVLGIVLIALYKIQRLQEHIQ